MNRLVTPEQQAAFEEMKAARESDDVSAISQAVANKEPGAMERWAAYDAKVSAASRAFEVAMGWNESARIQTPAETSTPAPNISEHIDAARLKRELRAMPQCSGPPRSSEGFEPSPPPSEGQREVGDSIPSKSGD